MAAADMKRLPSGYRCNGCKWCGSSFRAACPNCGGTDLVEEKSLGAGKVLDFVPVLYPPDNLKELGQYVSLLVQFNEGFKMFGIYLGKSADFYIGCPVVVSSFDETTKRLIFERV
jgi:uncharacterized OB-fold protein